MSASTTPTPIRITTFPLNAKHLTISGIIGLVILLSSSHSFVAPGSPLWDNALKHVAASPATLYTIQDWAFRLLVGTHALEVPAFYVLKLRKHGISLFSLLGLKWLLAVALGGKETWDLFAGAVRSAEKRRL